MKTSITNTSITEGQKKQYRRFVEDATEKAEIWRFSRFPSTKMGFKGSS